MEEALCAAESAQISLNPNVKTKSRVMPDTEVKAMPVDFGKASGAFEDAAAYIEKSFLQ